MYPRAMPLSRRCSNQTKPNSHSRPRSSQRRYSSALSSSLMRGGPGVCGVRTSSAPAPFALLLRERFRRDCSTVGMTIEPTEGERSGMGEGGSGTMSDLGSGGMRRILKEKMIDPSAKRDVSGKEENALCPSQC